jgi:hypothetical protein
MAGYAGYSKSNNAVLAESQDRYPLSKAQSILAKKVGCTLAQARVVLLEVGSCEKHHTSKRYNWTYYYSIEDALEYLTENPLPVVAPVQKPETRYWSDCTVTYLEWTGTRNHLTCRKVTLISCSVTRKRNTYTITAPTGAVVTKRATTRGLEITFGPETGSP